MTYALRIRQATQGQGEQLFFEEIDYEARIRLCEVEQQTHDLVLKHFRQGPGMRQLDAGCGLGRWVIYLTRKGYDITGVDIAGEGLEELVQRFPEVKAQVADLFHLPFGDQTFQGIISNGVVEHFEGGPVPVLKEMHRVLQDDGVLICIVPYQCTLRTLVHKPLSLLRYWVRGLQGTKLQFEEYRFSKTDYLNKLKEAGFRIEEVGWVELTDPATSYTLYVDFGKVFQDPSRAQIFGITQLGQALKRTLNTLSPWTHCEGIVAVCRKA
ncbi:MAG TPA: methyltransferase domain-containing protein [bacterium]|nr:methyltransferase domain-containing protein [bacterium]